MKKTTLSTWLPLLLFACSTYSVNAQQPGGDKNADFYDQPKESALNTASLSADGKTFKLVLIGDCLPQFFINGEKIGRNELPFYEDNITQLSKIIEERQKKEWQRAATLRERVKQQIVADIIDRKLVTAKIGIKSYYLTSRRFLINGKLQDPESFHFFRNKYVKSEDLVFYFDSEN